MKNFRIVLFFILGLIPAVMATNKLDPKYNDFIKIRNIIIETKGFHDLQINKIANWIMIYADKFLKNEHRYDIATCLFKVESNFNAIYGDNGRAFGLGQIHLGTALKVCKMLNMRCEMQELPDKLIQDIRFNIKISLAYLGILEEYYHGDIEKAIVAYNTGEGFLDRFIDKYNRIPQTSHLLKMKFCLHEAKN